MPKINVDHIVSFSSEDPVHVASNILSSDLSKKWKCLTPGEKSCTIILQLSKATEISAIDIGNENSAYIEVLVSRSGSDDGFKTLLVMSSFMTPAEAREGTNPNKVRMFTKEQLCKPECEQKWDKVKIICSQPFNRNVQFGLSFIILHSPGDAVKVNTPSLDKFQLKPSGSDYFVGSLFDKMKQGNKTSLSAAVAIRESANSPSSSLSRPKFKPQIETNNTNNINDDDFVNKARNRNAVFYDKSDEEPNEKIDKIIERKLQEHNEKKDKKEKDNKTPIKKQIQEDKEKKVKKENDTKAAVFKKQTPETSSSHNKRKKNQDESPRSKKTKLSQPAKVFVRKPFSKLLEGVMLVISGIQNPSRKDLRDMALKMGAKYKPDWDNSCTHLICAFPNTPKFNQVKGKGKIVKKQWLEECYSQRKRLPWRRFCLDKNDIGPESDDEIWEEQTSNKVNEKINEPSTSNIVKEINGNNKNTSKTPSFNESESENEGYDDTEMQKRIEEIKAKEKRDNPSNVFTIDTDDEEIISNISQEIKKKIPEFLKEKLFFIDPSLDSDIRTILQRYIIAYKGTLINEELDNISYYITSEEKVEKIRKHSNPNFLFLRPDWLWDCHNNQSLVSTDEYEL